MPPLPRVREYSEIVFDNIHFDPEAKRIRGKKSWSLKSGVSWSCPACGCLIPEDVMRKQPAKWIADNPDAYKKGVRSLAQCLLEPVDSVGEDRPQVPRRQG